MLANKPMARSISTTLRRAAVGVASLAVVRVKDTPSQLTLRAEERRDNMEDAFQAQREAVAGARTLVIDDVCTTGATLEACALALKGAGAASVWGVTLAREA